MLAAIVAMGTNRVIGRDGGLPWRLPDELKHFKQTTMGRVVIIGRRTLEEELGKPLPGRPHVVITRNRSWSMQGVEVRHDLDSAIERARELAGPEAWADLDRCPVILGGGQVYAEAMPRVDRLYMTVVDANPEGDTRFPELEEADWVEQRAQHHAADDRHAHAFTIRVLDRMPEGASRTSPDSHPGGTAGQP